METHLGLVQVRRLTDFHASRAPVYPGVHSLLVVRDDRLGDLVLTLPAIERLKVAYPGARIGLLVQPELAPMAALFAPVDEVLCSGRDLAATTQTIREFSPDAAVCISRRASAARALRRAGVRQVTGTGRRLFSVLFDRRSSVSRRGVRRHELEHALDLAACAGASAAPPRFPIELPAGTADDVDRWLRTRGIEEDPIVIHPGSGGSCPAWPPDRWRQLAAELRAAGNPLVVTRGPADRAALEPFAGGGFVEFDRSLPELAALLQRARLVASNSTGPIHLASALDRPTLAIHAPWQSCSFERWGPYNEHGWALVVGRVEAGTWSRRRRRRQAAVLMRRLTVVAVRQAVESILGWTRPPAGVP